MDTIRFTLIRARRKTLSVQVTQEGEVIVRAPQRMAESEIRRFLEEKQGWIARNLIRMEDIREKRDTLGIITEEQLQELTSEAKTRIRETVAIRAAQIGVTYNRITIRSQRTRWGSCSAKGNLNFNCMLMLCPEEVIDYVVVHELCHRKEMNHSIRFWTLVEHWCPGYRDARKWLKKEGAALLARVR